MAAAVVFLVLLCSATLGESETGTAADGGPARGLRLIDPWDMAVPAEEPARRGGVCRHWAAVRGNLTGTPGAWLLAADPDVWLLPDLLTSDAADQLAGLMRAPAPPRGRGPQWCFNATEHRVHDKFPDVNMIYDEEGLQCTQDQEAGPRMVARMNRSVSRSWVFAAGESAIVDRAAKSIEDGTGLPPTHAQGTQLIEYGREDEGAPAPEECGGGGPGGCSGTALVYLRDVDAGGHTCFPRRGFCVMPRKGAGLVIASLDSDCRRDASSAHAATRVTGGTGTAALLQRRYSADYFVPAPEADRVLCGAERCSHAVHSESRLTAARLAEQGSDLAARDKPRAARAKFEAALRAHLGHGRASMGYGELLYTAGELKEAQRHFRKALVEAPRWPDAHYFLGQIAADRGRHSTAAKHFRTLVDGNPGDENGWWLLASALAEMRGMAREALQAVERHLSMFPDDESARELRQQLARPPEL